MSLLNYIFPAYCIGCKKKWDYLCQKCKTVLTLHDEICYVCHKKSNNFETHKYCKSDTKLFEWVIIGFYYTNIIKKLIINFKYNHRKSLLNSIWELVYINILLHYKEDIQNTAITYVPMHLYRKYFVKWYNQSELLAHFLSKKLDLPLIDISKKTKYTSPQSKLTKKWRLKNIKSSFTTKKIENMEFQNLIIIDDIFTTWATLNELGISIKSQYPDLKLWWFVLWKN